MVKIFVSICAAIIAAAFKALQLAVTGIAVIVAKICDHSEKQRALKVAQAQAEFAAENARQNARRIGDENQRIIDGLRDQLATEIALMNYCNRQAHNSKLDEYKRLQWRKKATAAGARCNRLQAQIDKLDDS